MKTLFEKQLKLTPGDEKTNVVVPFKLEENYKRLFISYSYAPKLLEDREKAEKLIEENLIRDAGDDAVQYSDYEKFMPLKNLITLSLNSDSDYRGAAHRQDSEQHHEIGVDFASPGFIRGEISRGKWRLVLNVHAVVTDEVSCFIKVEAEEECV